jgi:outer membrane PBP1 activator LpoA protein
VVEPDAAKAPEALPASPPDAKGAATPAPATAWLALMLPLQSPTYGRAADAVKQGFSAAASAAAVKFDVITHGDGDVRAALDSAKASGARVIVGPLVRDDVRAIAGVGRDVPWIIALNQLDEGNPLPVRVYTLALAIDGEARQLARRARSDGAQSVVIVGGETALQKRFADAFVGEWILAGGGPPATLRFDRAPGMLAVLRREFTRAAPDAVLLAVDAQDAALAKPYLGTVTAYASSQVNDRQAERRLVQVLVTQRSLPSWIRQPRP